ncbi:MAG: LamG-like jellyroll fold domain-containing protein [Planctomycetota bacterium]
MARTRSRSAAAHDSRRSRRLLSVENLERRQLLAADITGVAGNNGELIGTYADLPGVAQDVVTIDTIRPTLTGTYSGLPDAQISVNDDFGQPIQGELRLHASTATWTFRPDAPVTQHQILVVAEFSGSSIPLIADDSVRLAMNSNALAQQAGYEALSMYPTHEGFETKHLITTEDKLIYSGWSDEFGLEPHILDPETGEITVIDLNPGISGSNPEDFAAFGSRVLFTAADPAFGDEVRWLDISENPTRVRTLDLTPGAASSGFPPTSEYALVGDRAYFLADRIDEGRELRWADLGDPVSEVNTLELVPGRWSPGILDFTVVNERLFFSASDNSLGRELKWIDSDGTVPSVHTLDLNPGSASSNAGGTGIEVVGDRLVFSAFDPQFGNELRSVLASDPRGGVTTFDANPGSTGSDPGRDLGITVNHTLAFFDALDEAGQRILQSIDLDDPAAPATTYNFLSGPNDQLLRFRVASAAGPYFFFSANTKSLGTELHWVDIRNGSTSAIDLAPGPSDSGLASTRGFEKVGNKLFFIARQQSVGQELHWIDLAEDALISRNLDIVPGPTDSAVSHPFSGLDLTRHGDTLYFTADDQGGRTQLSRVKSDNVASSLRTFDHAQSQVYESRLEPFQSGERLFLSSRSTADGVYFSYRDVSQPHARIRELFVANPPGSQQRIDVTIAYVVGSRVFAYTNDQDHGKEVGWFDLTSDSPTFAILDLHEGPSSSRLNSGPEAVVHGDYFLFVAAEPEYGQEFRYVDASEDTPRITTLDVNPGHASSDARYFQHVGSHLVFEADSRDVGNELRWINLEADTLRVSTFDIEPGNGNSDPNLRFSVATDDRIYFNAKDRAMGTELRWIDFSGTSATSHPPTVQTLDYRPGPDSGVIDYWQTMHIVADTLYFSADDGVTGERLRLIDSNDAIPVVRSLDIEPLDGFSFDSVLFTADQHVYFASDPGTQPVQWAWVLAGESEVTPTRIEPAENLHSNFRTSQRIESPGNENLRRYLLSSEFDSGSEPYTLDVSDQQVSILPLESIAGVSGGQLDVERAIETSRHVLLTGLNPQSSVLYVFDKPQPTAFDLTAESDKHRTSSLVALGEVITVTLSSDEHLQDVTGTVADQPVRFESIGVGQWKAEAQVNASSPEGSLSVDVSFRNEHGDLESATLTEVGGLVIDRTRPALEMVAEDGPTQRASESDPPELDVLLTFSEPVRGLELDDLQASETGVIQELRQIDGDGRVYQITFVGAVGFSGAVTISVPEGSLTDLAGNPAIAGGDQFTVTPYVSAPPLPDAVTALSFEEGVGRESADQSSSGTVDDRGVLHGGATWLSEDSSNGAIRLDANGSYIHVPDTIDINARDLDDATVSVWFRVDENEHGDKQIIYKQGGDSRGVNLYLDQGRLFAGVWSDDSNPDGTFISSEPVPLGSWNHAALTLGASDDGEFRLHGYLNGETFGASVASAIEKHMGDVSLGRLTNSTRFHDGTAGAGSQPSQLFGSIDEFRFYDVALNSEQVLALSRIREPYRGADQPPAAEPPAPVTWYDFASETDTVIQDRATTGQADPAQLVGSSYWANDPARGNVLGLTEEGGYLAIADSPDFNTETVLKKTISFWFQADDVTAGRKQVLFKQSGLTRGISVYLDSGDLYVGGWSDKAGWSGTFLRSPDVTSGKWHHVTLVMDTAEETLAGTISAFLDGEQFAQGPAAAIKRHRGNVSFGDADQGTRFHDGDTRTIDGPYGFMGQLDAIRVFDVALTDEQVRSVGGFATPIENTQRAAGGEPVGPASVIVATQPARILQNDSIRWDVNDDGRVSAIDALQVINRLNSKQETHPAAAYVDTSGDGIVSALDALHVINQLNAPDTEHADGTSSLDDDDEPTANWTSDRVDQALKGLF